MQYKSTTCIEFVQRPYKMSIEGETIYLVAEAIPVLLLISKTSGNLFSSQSRRLIENRRLFLLLANI